MGAARRAPPGRRRGVRFAVWAPNARGVSVVGDWNYWSADADALEPQGSSGVWAGVVPNAREGHRYKFSIRGFDGVTRDKADPIAFRAESRPRQARSSTARGTSGRTTTGSHAAS